MALRVGIIGAGFIGDVHASILSEDKRVTIASVYDINAERAAKLANRVGASVAESADTLLDQVNAVYIATPNTGHAKLVLSALTRDVHVFSEKPMATNLKEARDILNACQRTKAIYQVGHNRRFAPVYKSVKRLLMEEAAKPSSAHIKMNRGELKKPYWTCNPDITGGYLYETTIHLFDMARWLFGDLSSLYCVASSNYYLERDDFSLVMTFASGMHATFASSAHASWFFPFERLEIFGDHVTIETQEMERISCSKGLDREIITEDFFQLPRNQKWGYAEEDKLFVDSIIDQMASAVSALDGYKAVEIAEACYLSAEIRAKVMLPL